MSPLKSRLSPSGFSFRSLSPHPFDCQRRRESRSARVRRRYKVQSGESNGKIHTSLPEAIADVTNRSVAQRKLGKRGEH